MRSTDISDVAADLAVNLTQAPPPLQALPHQAKAPLPAQPELPCAAWTSLT